MTGTMIQLGDLSNYMMAQGKCRMKDKSKTDGWDITQQVAPNNAACAMDCDNEPTCTAFHFYKKNMIKPTGACVVWTDTGLYPNGEITSDCYLKKSMNPGVANDKNLKQLTNATITKKKSYTKTYPKGNQKKNNANYYMPDVNLDDIKDWELPTMDDAMNQLSNWMNEGNSYTGTYQNYYYGY